jgi:hypothetical protein
MMLPEQVKSPVALVTVQPVEPEPPARRTSPVLIPPMDTVLAPLASMVSAPVPDIAVPETLSEFTAVALRVPPETLPPDNVPPEIVALFIVEVQAKAPVELVTVQPVEPDPPPNRMSPVEVPPIWTCPVVEPSRVKFCAVPPEATASALAPVMLPMFTKLPELSMRWVPAPAPVLMPVVPFIVVPVIVFVVAIVPKPEAIEPDESAPVPVIAVLTASLVSTKAASLPSKRSSSVELIVAPEVTMLLEPTLKLPFNVRPAKVGVAVVLMF